MRTIWRIQQDLPEYSHHGSYEITIKEKARSLVEEHTSFLPHEFNWEDSIADFSIFLSKYQSSIIYDSVTEKILITPVTRRTAPYKLYEYNYPDQLNADSLLNTLEEDTGIDFKELQTLFHKKNSRLLYILASRWYIADKYRYSSLHSETFERLFALLANVLVSVKDRDGRWIWTYEKDYWRIARLNQLVYWANHYRDYQWDVNKQKFINKRERIARKPSGIKLLTTMQSEDDSVAIRAFIKMTNIEPALVNQLPVDDFSDNMNSSLPIFQKNFLSVLSEYTRYCSQNKISLRLVGRIKDWFFQLAQEDMPFSKRYHLENEITAKATPYEISALEYWFLVSEENWEITFSAGRIIDKFYSFHWNLITHDTRQLKHYLKKAALFDRLGIIGNCNKYLKKFHITDDKVKANLAHIFSISKDKDVIQSAKKSSHEIKISYDPVINKVSNANYDTIVTDLRMEYIRLVEKPHEYYENPLDDLTALVEYSQIEDFLSWLKEKGKYDEVYDFLERDFGFPVEVKDTLQMREFLTLYKKVSYENICRYYLDKCGLNYKKPDGSLNYQAIYEILEFDVVDALAGGGGNHRETGVYLLIKVLEFEFNTTLGFPKKLCNGGGIYGCSSDERAREWMNYLLIKKLATPFVNLPWSISPLGIN